MEGRRMTKRIIGNLTILAALLAFSAGASAQDAKLVDAAKAEGGKVVVYGSLENETMDLVAAGVKKKSRSEEHMSELQSHSLISYAVFCLKKQNKYNKKPYAHTSWISCLRLHPRNRH